MAAIKVLAINRRIRAEITRLQVSAIKAAETLRELAGIVQQLYAREYELMTSGMSLELGATSTAAFLAIGAWLTTQLIHKGHFRRLELQQDLLLRLVVRWHFWLLVLDESSSIQSFCALPSRTILQEQKAACEVRAVLLSAAQVLADVFSILGIPPGEMLSLPTPSASKTRQASIRTRPRTGNKVWRHRPRTLHSRNLVDPETEFTCESGTRRFSCDIDVRLTPGGVLHRAMLDSGAECSSIPHGLLHKLLPDPPTRQLPATLLVQGAGGIERVESVAVLDILVPAHLNGALVTVKIKAEFEVVEGSIPHMLIGMDVIKRHAIIIDPVAEYATFSNAGRAKASLFTETTMPRSAPSSDDEEASGDEQGG